MVIYTLVIVEIQNSVTQTMATSAQGICIFLKKQKLRNFFTETPKFREPQPSNYSSCKKEIDPAIEEFAGSLRIKHKLENTAMDLWVNKVKEKVKNKMKSLKSKQIDNTFHVLQDEEKVRQYLRDLQTKICIVLIDKASNSF